MQYNQTVKEYVPPTWEEEWLMPKANAKFIADRGGMKKAKPAPPAVRFYAGDKPILASAQLSACNELYDNSIYSNSQHWDGPAHYGYQITGVKRKLDCHYE